MYCWHCISATCLLSSISFSAAFSSVFLCAILAFSLVICSSDSFTLVYTSSSYVHTQLCSCNWIFTSAFFLNAAFFFNACLSCSIWPFLFFTSNENFIFWLFLSSTSCLTFCWCLICSQITKYNCIVAKWWFYKILTYVCMYVCINIHIKICTCSSHAY